MIIWIIALQYSKTSLRNPLSKLLSHLYIPTDLPSYEPLNDRDETWYTVFTKVLDGH